MDYETVVQLNPEAEGEADTDGGDGETDADGEADADGGDGEACADGGDGEEKVGKKPVYKRKKRKSLHLFLMKPWLL